MKIPLAFLAIMFLISVCHGQPGPYPVDILYGSRNTTDPTNAQGAIKDIDIIFSIRDINPANASIMIVMREFFLKEGSSASLMYGDQTLQTWNGPGWIDEGDGYWKPTGIGAYDSAKNLTLKDGFGKTIQSVRIPFRGVSIMELHLTPKDADTIVHQYNLMDNTIVSSRIIAEGLLSCHYII